MCFLIVVGLSSFRTSDSMEVRFLVSGEKLTVLDSVDFDGRTVEEVKGVLSSRVGISKFRQRLFVGSAAAEIGNDWVFGEAVDLMISISDFALLDIRQEEIMMDAATDGCVSEIENLHQLPADPNSVRPVKQWKIPGEIVHFCTLLHAAAFNGHVEVLRLLIEARADTNVNEVIHWARTPLFCAVQCASVAAVNVLLEGKADPERLGWKEVPERRDMLHFAIKRGRIDIIESLIAHDADVNRRSPEGVTPLMEAAGRRGWFRLVEFLLESGGRCDIEDKRGRLAIDHAASCSQDRVVRLLMKPTVQHLEEVGVEITRSWCVGKKRPAGGC